MHVPCGAEHARALDSSQSTPCYKIAVWSPSLRYLSRRLSRLQSDDLRVPSNQVTPQIQMAMT
ncbi:hypothetical protein MIR68_000536 [Amoeboaphelidium protococcarum]|nr:hypothetical protein MIR68_000536 [Amoeboaphelidium protococcarum]